MSDYHLIYKFGHKIYMIIKKAKQSDADIIEMICKSTISEIYPHYYSRGAVEFFLSHHSKENIINDIKQENVFLGINNLKNIVGTVTIKDNEICRLFVLPVFQRKGYGSELLDYAEKLISRRYDQSKLDASLPARKIYRKKGYMEVEFNIIQTFNRDFLCYDVMIKNL